MVTASNLTISVITPTLSRPEEIEGMLQNLGEMKYLPKEVIYVDGAPESDNRTQKIIKNLEDNLPFEVVYIRSGGGTAVQRNIGIEEAKCDLISFIDDDIRLEIDFFNIIVHHFQNPKNNDIGGIVGYRTNEHINASNHKRWYWYKKLGIYSNFEPGKFDYKTGYPINVNLQPPFTGTREVDFMTTACAVWRREVLDDGFRFDEFFKNYGVLEDAHFSLRAGKKWKLIQAGDARCVHLRSVSSRESSYLVAIKTAINYRYVFIDIIPNRTITQEFRFWSVQLFDLCHFIVYAIRNWQKENWLKVLGKLVGIFKAIPLSNNKFQPQ